MNIYKEILNTNHIYNEKILELNTLIKNKYNKLLDLDIIKKECSYKECKEILHCVKDIVNKDILIQLDEIIKEKRINKYPDLLDAHYYPSIKEIDFLSKEERFELDSILNRVYKVLSDDIKIELFAEKINNKYNKNIIDILVNKNLINKIYVFHCDCESDFECPETIITNEELNGYKGYWDKIKNNQPTTNEEDRKYHYGTILVECYNEPEKEITSFKEFIDNLYKVKYKVINAPYKALDNL